MGKREAEGNGEKILKKKGGIENRSSTMPLVIFNFYRVQASERKGQRFSAKVSYIQDGIWLDISRFCADYFFGRVAVLKGNTPKLAAEAKLK